MTCHSYGAIFQSSSFQKEAVKWSCTSCNSEGELRMAWTNGYFYMHMMSWMCHASWLQASLTNSVWSSSWPVRQTRPLCELSTWPITFLLLKRANRCFFSRGRLLHLPSLGRWIAALEGHKEGQANPSGLLAPPPGFCRCCHQATQSMTMYMTVFLSQSHTLPHSFLSAQKAHSSITNGMWICYHMEERRYKAFAIAYWLFFCSSESYFCYVFLVLLLVLCEQYKANSSCVLINLRTFGWGNSAEQYIYFAFLNGSN